MSERFSIKRYSKKIQRKYARIKAAPVIGSYSGETVAESYRNALTKKTRINGTLSAYLKAYLGTPAKHRATRSQLRIESLCTNGSFKTPPTADRDWTGIELELSFDVNKIPPKYINQHGDTNSYRAALASYLRDERVSYYHLKSDSSIIEPKHEEGKFWQTVEICILTRATGPMQNVRRLCEVLKKLDGRVNRRCGLHVHLDMRGQEDRTVNLLGNRFMRALPLLLAMQHPLRRDSRYCLPTRNEITSGHADRYVAINLSAMQKFSTIEIRMHSGTTCADKIIHWVKLLHAIKTTEFDGFILSPNDALLKLPKLTASTVNYITARVELFSGDLRAVATKNRCTVPFVDEDADEVKLADVANYELLERLISETKKCETWRDVASFIEEQEKHAEELKEELGEKHALLFYNLIEDMIDAAKERTNFNVNRNAHNKAELIKQIYSAKTLEALEAIREDIDDRRMATEEGPRYIPSNIGDELRSLLNARFSIVKNAPDERDTKIFDFGAHLLATRKTSAAGPVNAIEATTEQTALFII